MRTRKRQRHRHPHLHPHHLPAAKYAHRLGLPHFTDHGTFIFALSLASAHRRYAGVKALRVFVRNRWLHRQQMTAPALTKPVDYALLSKLIDYNIQDKKDLTSYWRKPEE